VNHTFLCFASSSASRHAKGMYWGDGIEGQLLSLRDGSARARIDLSPRTRWEVRASIARVRTCLLTRTSARRFRGLPRCVVRSSA
jgi:ribosomal protein L29